jgi:predicted SAM-dependent methyltransferase
MSSQHIVPWIEANRDLIRGPVLEIGSRHYKDFTVIDLRGGLCAGIADFTGCDVQAGKNVDVVVDIASAEDVRRAFGARRFRTLFCLSVLEHIPDAFNAARNMASLLEPGGALFLSVPFIFRHHGYPGDYWRFTPEAVRFLYPSLRFDGGGSRNTLAALDTGEVAPLPETFEKRNSFTFRPRSRPFKILRKNLKKWGWTRWIPPYSLAPTMVNMIGIRPETGP